METTTPITPATATQPEAIHAVEPLAAADVDPRVVQRAALRSRHSQNLTRLMEERDDLHGVHALADFVAEQLRWTA